MEGISVRPTFTGKPMQRKQSIFWKHEGNRAVRDGKWELVSSFTDGSSWELYDMEAARAEMQTWPR
jgi:arylsulfatase